MSQFAAWAERLEGLLARAEAAAASDELEERLGAMRALTQFVVDSTPNTPDILALDALAERARTDLVLQIIQERVASITARSGELVSVRKKFGQLAADAHRAAARINLTQVQNAVESLTSATFALQDLRAALTSGQHEAIGEQISQVLVGMQKLRSEVEGLA